MENGFLTGTFEEGRKGLICRCPSDGGAFIVPDRTSQSVEPGVEHALEITGQTANGRLRFARVVVTLANHKAGVVERVQKFCTNITSAEEVLGKDFGGGWKAASYVSPDDCDIDETGQPVLRVIRIHGRRIEGVRYDSSYEVNLVPLSSHVLAPEPGRLRLLVERLTGWAHMGAEAFPEWAMDWVKSFLALQAAVKLLRERTGQRWNEIPAYRPGYVDHTPDKWARYVYRLFQEAGITNLRDALERIEFPLAQVREELDALLNGMPARVRLSDGVERAVEWSGQGPGLIFVSEEQFSDEDLGLDPTDERARAVVRGLALAVSRKRYSEGDRPNDLDFHHYVVTRIVLPPTTA